MLISPEMVNQPRRNPFKFIIFPQQSKKQYICKVEWELEEDSLNESLSGTSDLALGGAGTGKLSVTVNQGSQSAYMHVLGST